MTSSPKPPVDTAELRRLRGEATGGQWTDVSDDIGPESGPEEVGITNGVDIVLGMGWCDGPHLVLRKADARLICAAVNALPALLDEVEEARTAIAGYESLCNSRRDEVRRLEGEVEALRAEVATSRAELVATKHRCGQHAFDLQRENAAYRRLLAPEVVERIEVFLAKMADRGFDDAYALLPIVRSALAATKQEGGG